MTGLNSKITFKVLGKEKLFNSIVAENSERIKRICSYYNSNEEDQKDLYQEVMINIWRSLDSFRGDSKVSTWVYRVAVNTSLSYRGFFCKESNLRVCINNTHLNSFLDEECVEEKLERQDRHQLLQNALNQLSVIDKLLVSLTIEGLSMREIADVIGITESNVKVKIHRIKKMLRENLS